MRRFLVVANRTLGGEHLLEKARELLFHGPCSFHIVVPATPVEGGATWTEGHARADAEARLQRALAAFRDAGVSEATGEVGDPNPMHAALDAIRAGAFDEVIVSTLPAGISRWLRQDLPHRLSRAIDRPVVHIVGEPEPARA